MCVCVCVCLKSLGLTRYTVQFLFTFIKIVTLSKETLDPYFIFFCKVFVLTWFKMTYVQAETCSIYVNVTIRNKTNQCCVRLNKCVLFEIYCNLLH